MTAGDGHHRAGRPARGAGRALAVIAKEPVAGQAKTRLAAALGPRAAARLAAAMLRDTVRAVARVDADPWLCFTPTEARERMAALAPGFGLLPQRGGGLGERLAACLEELVERGAGRVAIVAADTPHLPLTAYEAGLALLDEADVTLGPALDGGYYLIGARRPAPELFAGVPMGTDAVLAATLERARHAGLRVRLLPPARDLDRVEDLTAALGAGELDGCPHTRAEAAGVLPAFCLDGH
ncbi:MAG TPA: TIGR04282 family arsenosugar biosynthesis glycosyltransferase [Actinomycetes bacterium]